MYPQVSQRPDGAPQNILLIDDETSVRTALRLLMQATGYNVKDFASPAEALEYLKHNQECELIICDLRMPKMNGLAMLSASKELLPEIPVILMSAQITNEELERARALGVSDFLNKPFMPDDLHRVTLGLGSKDGPERSEG